MKTIFRVGALAGAVSLVATAGLALAWSGSGEPQIASVRGLPENTAIEYGSVSIDAKWEGDQTRGAGAVTFKTKFADPPIVLVNQFGRGGWHFFVHAQSTKDHAHFSVMLDRSFEGNEPRTHPCEIAFVAIGKAAKD